MSDSNRREKVFRILYFIGLIAFVIGLPLNKVVLSLSSLWLIAITLIRGNWKTVWLQWKQTRWLKLLFLFFCWYLISLFWSHDLSFAWKDLQIKAPFFLLPFVFVAHPFLTSKESRLILTIYTFVMALIALINWGFYHQWWGNKTYDDIRGMSLFISHVRFSLMITLAWAISWYFVFTNSKSLTRLVFFFLAIGFTLYAYYAQVLSGILTMIGVFSFGLFYVYKQTELKSIKWVIWIITICGLGLFSAGLVYFFQPEKCKIDLTDRPEFTAEGNPYYYDASFVYLENGYPIYWFINTEELRREWNKRASIPLDSLDKKGQPLHGTVLRYMTSKGLRKDAIGVQQLNSTDIQRIEAGIPSVVYGKTGIWNRIRGLKTEFKNQHDPNGHSLLQRLEYWKSGWQIWQKHFVFGVGIGDVQQQFDQVYRQNNSLLHAANRLRTHQQFLTIAISTGLIGLLIFVVFWISWLRSATSSNRFLTVASGIICLLSFLVEDTLETQMGVAFVVFCLLFTSLFDLSKKEISS